MLILQLFLSKGVLCNGSEVKKPLYVKYVERNKGRLYYFIQSDCCDSAERSWHVVPCRSERKNKTKPNTQLSVETNSNKFDICDRLKLFFNTLLHIPDSVGAELCELGLVEVYESGIFLVS